MTAHSAAAPKRVPGAQPCMPPRGIATVSSSRRRVRHRAVLLRSSSSNRGSASRPAGASVHIAGPGPCMAALPTVLPDAFPTGQGLHQVGAAEPHGQPGRRSCAQAVRGQRSGRGGTGQSPPGEMSRCPGSVLQRSFTQRRAVLRAEHHDQDDTCARHGSRGGGARGRRRALPKCNANSLTSYGSRGDEDSGPATSGSSTKAADGKVGAIWRSLFVKGCFLPPVRRVCSPVSGSPWNVHLKAVIARCGAQPIGHAGQFVHVRNGGAFGICITLPVQAQPDLASGTGRGSSRARRRIPGRTLSHKGAPPSAGSGRRRSKNACGEQAGCERGNSRRHQEAGAGGVGGATPPDTRTRQCTTRPGHRACAKRLFGRVTTSRSEEPLGSFADVLAHVSGAQDRPARTATTARQLAFVLASRPPESSGRTT